ncbi:hypothetical protein TNCV_4977201 [Trichonephila clavipes]|nr:hypothetical protein TNCV_4977201 [Trichonephila clavipes]
MKWRGGKYILQHPCNRGFCCDRPQDFRSIDLTSTYSLFTWKVLGGFEQRTQSLRLGVQCSNSYATHCPPRIDGCLKRLKAYVKSKGNHFE